MYEFEIAVISPEISIHAMVPFVQHAKALAVVHLYVTSDSCPRTAAVNYDHTAGKFAPNTSLYRFVYLSYALSF